MPRVKVRYALIHQPPPEGEGPRMILHYRGDVVDLPQEYLDTLPAGAVIGEEDELDRPGVLMALRESPTDEELFTWVGSATPTEIEAMMRERQDLVPRLAGMSARLEQMFLQRKEKFDLVELQAQDHAERRGVSATLVGSTMTDPERTEDEGTETDGTETDSEPSAEEVVGRSTDEVVGYIADHPERATEILEAESARTKGKPRNAVSAAAQAAQAHT